VERCRFPAPRKRSLSASQFWGSFLFMSQNYQISHMGRWLFRWSDTPPPTGAGSQRSPILGVRSFLFVHTPLTQNYQISHGNTYGDGACFLRHQPHQGVGVPALPNFGFFLIFMRTPFISEVRTTKFDVVINACILGSATPAIPRARSMASSFFLWGGVLLYLCLHTLTQNDQWALHKCAARFVSDS